MAASMLRAPRLAHTTTSAQQARTHQRVAVLSKPATPLLSGSMSLKASTRAARLGKVETNRSVTTMSLFGLGGPEILVIGVVAAVVFGPSKLPELGRGLGKTVKSFQGAAEEFKEELNNAATEDGEEPKEEPTPVKAEAVKEEPKKEEPKKE
uniref:Sec-independent protein translocase protein TatA n=1 Tax=Pyramimonas obovata TaxID=1411642 RepID=A0A7S0MPT5_9CHLO|eukprot:CAMPEP_0118933984 /NCGR_PEP_ID=MMETSP1169-20130426/13205_1 /TAXON_ID=36882 /ORGANISM="Pyramimonas obovata, Strain CCMP722" /LENGTH=151 /DNA_ID=CAMNT_0006876835 /DNA_START=43 /DNA_END=498 /DNA_ORIENTATION=-